MSLTEEHLALGINEYKKRKSVFILKRGKMRLTKGGRVSWNGEGGVTIMMGFKERAFAPLVAVSLEELVPQDHFYRHLQRVLDLTFVHDLVREYYEVAPFSWSAQRWRLSEGKNVKT